MWQCGFLSGPEALVVLMYISIQLKCPQQHQTLLRPSMEISGSTHAVRTCASSEQCARWRLQDPTGTHALASIKVAAASAPDSVATPSVRIEVKPSPAAASFHRRTTYGIAGQMGGPAQHGTGPLVARPAKARPVRHGNCSGPCRAGPRAKASAQARPKEVLGRAGPARLLLRHVGR